MKDKDQILKAKQSNAIVAFRKGTDSEKELLKNLFGADAFLKCIPIEERINNMSDVYRETGEDMNTYIPASLPEHVKSYMEAELIIRAYNDGWIPDYTDGKSKYYPWMKYASSGFVFNFYCDFDSRTNVSARLCFKKLDIMKIALSKFPNEFSIFFQY